MRAGGAILSLIFQKKRQTERDKLEDNPSGWFNEHFDGVRNDTDPDEADKTNTKN